MRGVASLQELSDWLRHELNFFRVHLLFFVVVPLVSAAIFWGANGEFPIAFVDALFLCYSALTVTGLSTVNLSTCTVFQQVILFFLMCIGNVTVVAWVMVLIRKSYFRSHLQKLKMRDHSKRKIGNRILHFLHVPHRGNKRSEPRIHVQGPSRSETGMSAAHGRIFVEEGIGAALVGGGSAGIGMGIGLGGFREDTVNGTVNGVGSGYDGLAEKTEEREPAYLVVGQSSPRPMGQPVSILKAPSPMVDSPPASIHSSEAEKDNAPTKKVLEDQQFTSDSPRSDLLPLPTSPVFSPRSQGTRRTQFTVPYTFSITSGSVRRRGVPMPHRRMTVYQSSYFSDGHEVPLGQREKDHGQGGFPGPIQLTQMVARRYVPQLYSGLKGLFGEIRRRDKKRVERLQDEFNKLIIGRNSDFNTEELSDDELEELGGLEYRALRLLSYLVAFYFVGTQLIAFTLIAPWLSTTHKYDDVFLAQPRLVNKSWFVAFQIVASYTGGGMSLVDQAMVPFQTAYLMIFAMMFVIVAGNQGLPIFLRLTIWIMTKFVKDGSRADKTLHFLLDHPRRCFLYLFPSHVTWFLLATFLVFTCIEWVSFIVLDLGLDVIESLSPGIQALTGVFQSFAIRASGFPIVSLSSLAPSFQFLCVVMMYIAVYPVAMSIRSTNVYEEQSLGVFEVEPEDQDEEPALRESQGSRRERIGRYFGWHLRRQVTYDIWWLVWGIFLVCVIERTKIMDDVNAPWFNIFRIMFELVSAFGGIGLTLGIPTENYSFSGAFGPLSKLVVIIIMLRGRHRGLPVAIDRAILLPEDMVPVTNSSVYDPRSPSSQVPPTAPTSNINSPQPGRSPTMSPKLERRVYSREGPQPNMMDLVDMTSQPQSPPKLDTQNLSLNGYSQGLSLGNTQASSKMCL